MKVYDPCPASVEARVASLIAKYHPGLQIAEVTFDLLYVARDSEDEGTSPVLTHHGYPALAVARIVPAKERAKGCADAEILIDRDRFTDSSPEQQDALLDHELNHFEVVRDADGNFKTDAGHRPRLAIRKHDYDFGWFECIARRHGAASIEVQQAKIMWDESGQSLFPFAGKGDGAVSAAIGDLARKMKAEGVTFEVETSAAV